MSWVRAMVLRLVMLGAGALCVASLSGCESVSGREEALTELSRNVRASCWVFMLFGTFGTLLAIWFSDRIAEWLRARFARSARWRAAYLRLLDVGFGLLVVLHLAFVVHFWDAFPMMAFTSLPLLLSLGYIACFFWSYRRVEHASDATAAERAAAVAKVKAGVFVSLLLVAIGHVVSPGFLLGVIAMLD